MTALNHSQPEGEYPHVRAAFINAIAEEGTKAEAVAWLQKQWNETCALRAELKALRGSGVQSESEPSRAAMMAAVELEILSCLGRVHTVKIGRLLQKIIDASLVWLPIDTAPLDADVLLGWWREWPERRWECASGLAGSTKGGWLHGQATHWQPLPAAPSLSSADCEPPLTMSMFLNREDLEAARKERDDMNASPLPSTHRGSES